MSDPRAAFLDALVGLVDPSITHFNKRCVSITTRDGQDPGASIIHFADGTTFEAEVVLGADGIRSNVRRTVTEQHDVSRVVFSRTVAYRALLPLEEILRAGVQIDFSKRPNNLVGNDKVRNTFTTQGTLTHSSSARHRVSHQERKDCKFIFLPSSVRLGSFNNRRSMWSHSTPTNRFLRELKFPSVNG